MTSYKKRILLKTAGAMAGLFLIWLLLRKTNMDQLLLQMKIINYNFVWIIAVTFISQLLGSIGWQYSMLENVPLRRFFSFFCIRLAGESLSQMNPASFVAGDTLKAVLLKNVHGTDYRKGAMSLLLWRIMYILATGFLLVFSLVFIFNQLNYDNLRIFSIGTGIIVVILFLYIFHSLQYEHGVFSTFAHFLEIIPGKLKFIEKTVSNLREIDTDMVFFYHSKKGSFYAVFILTVFHRIIGSLEYYVILNVLGMDVGVFTCILFDTVTLLFRSAGSFIPGQIGFEEFGNKLMFSVAGVPGNETWLTVSVIRRARQLFWIAAGFIVYLLISRNFRDKIRESSEIHAG